MNFLEFELVHWWNCSVKVKVACESKDRFIIFSPSGLIFFFDMDYVLWLGVNLKILFIFE